MEAGLDVGRGAGHSHHGLGVEVSIVHLQVQLEKGVKEDNFSQAKENLFLVPLGWEGNQPLTAIARLLLVTHVLYDLRG